MSDTLPPVKAPPKAPRRSLKKWGAFFHMLARFYQNYEQAVLKAARRKKNRAVDVDGQKSKQGTGWALHWPTLGKNKLHDPKGQYGKNTRIDHLTDAELDRMRGPKGEHPRRISYILRSAEERNVRVEFEPKVEFDDDYAERLNARPYVQSMKKKGLIQVKSLAFYGATSSANNSVDRLAPWHRLGFTTILTFTDFGNRKGISKKKAWPVTDYYRGRPKWTA